MARDVAEREVRVERDAIQLALHRKLQQRLQLRRERERAVRETRVQERLLADAVTGQDEPRAPGVPQREREHPMQPLDEARAVLLVEVRDHGRVAASAHVVPA
jgi:hypothetical protein